MRIAFLGTGLLGSGFVQHLLATTSSVTVWNRTAARAQPLVAAGARAASSPAEAADGAGRIHLCLKDDASVDEVLAGALESAPADAVVIDHTTTSADGAAARAERLVAQGRAFLHAPVFMSPAMAREAKGMMLVSGPEPVFRRVEAAMAAMTGDLWYLGADSRRAAAFKLLGNSFLIAMVGALADTFALARGLEVTPADVLELLARFRPGGLVDMRAKRMATGDFAPGFELTMARKDIGLMLDAVGEAPLAALRAIAARADELIARGHGSDDFGVLGMEAVGAGR